VTISKNDHEKERRCGLPQQLGENSGKGENEHKIPREQTCREKPKMKREGRSCADPSAQRRRGKGKTVMYEKKKKRSP